MEEFDRLGNGNVLLLPEAKNSVSHASPLHPEFSD